MHVYISVMTEMLHLQVHHRLPLSTSMDCHLIYYKMATTQDLTISPTLSNFLSASLPSPSDPPHLPRFHFHLDSSLIPSIRHMAHIPCFVCMPLSTLYALFISISSDYLFLHPSQSSSLLHPLHVYMASHSCFILFATGSHSLMVLICFPIDLMYATHPPQYPHPSRLYIIICSC